MYATHLIRALESGLRQPLMGKRDQCNDQGCAELPTSTFEKTVVPVIIGVVLFVIVFIVFFIIVRKRRLQDRRMEEAAQAKIDMDDVEDRAAFRAGRKQ